MKKTHDAVTGEGSALSRYQKVVIGDSSVRALLYYEMCQLLVFIPGALGMVLRKILWPRMFAECGKGTVFGAGVVIRHPKKIKLGKAVVVSEYCVLDGRNSTKKQSIMIGDNVILSNNVMLSCKQGMIYLGNDVGINAQTIIQSTNGNEVTVDADCVIGQRCFVIGGGNYDISQKEELIRTRPIATDGGVRLKKNVWLGGNVTVLGGVTLGEGSVAAAGSVISKSLPPYSVCMGVPARVVKERT
jgi:acetyltransferase-like isoleucine patch superfamily enzyme